MKKTWHSLKNRVTAMLLALICVLGLLPTAALAAGADTIKLERFGMSGVSYQSASLGRCTMHQMYYGVAGKTSVGFCGTKGGGMGTSRAQYHLRQTCVYLDLRVLNKPELFSNAFSASFAANGAVADNPEGEKLAANVRALMEELARTVRERKV